MELIRTGKHKYNLISNYKYRPGRVFEIRAARLAGWMDRKTQTISRLEVSQIKLI